MTRLSFTTIEHASVPDSARHRSPLPSLGAVIVLLALMGLLACSAHPNQAAPARIGGGAAAGTGAAAGQNNAPVVLNEMPTCAADNPFCQTSPVISKSVGAAGSGPLVSTTTNCGKLPVELKPAGVNIMLAVDGALSMKSHWTDVATAVRSLRSNNPSASFGMHVFWGTAVDPMAEDGQATRNTTNNACRTYENKVLELGNHTADELVSFMGAGPMGGVIDPA